MLNKIVITFIFIFFYSISWSQSTPKFDTFKGKAYALDFREISKEYGDYIYDYPVLAEIEWEEINISDRHIEDGFPDLKARTQMFGLELHSTLTISEKSCYEFILNSDDGSILWIDNQGVVYNGKSHEMTEKRDTVELDVGTYAVKLWYYQAYPDRFGFIFNANNVGSICAKKLEKKTTQAIKAKPKREKITLTDAVFFDVNQFQIKEASKAQLNNICTQIKNKNPTKIIIAGHTDNTGKAAHNLKLSQNRAQAIRDYLMAKVNLPGVDFIVRGVGENMPIASNETEEGRSQNRRVEIIIE